MKKEIHLNESQIRNIVNESVKRILNESNSALLLGVISELEALKEYYKRKDGQMQVSEEQTWNFCLSQLRKVAEESDMR